MMFSEKRIEAVADAWVVEGPVPEAHRKAQELLRREWPVLAEALDALVTEGQGEFEPGQRVIVNQPNSRYHRMLGEIVGEASEWSHFEWRVKPDGAGVAVSFMAAELVRV